MGFLLPAFIALLAIIVPGFFLAFALLKKTKLNTFEIGTIGFMFGLIFPPTMTWLESYLIPLSSAFAFSVGLYNLNVIVLTIIGIILCIWQGVLNLDSIKPFLGMASAKHKEPHHTLSTEAQVIASHEMGEPLIPKAPEKKHSNKIIWYVLVALMLITFATRLMSLPAAANFFEFDPYFDLLSTESILVHGYQVLYDHSAWPILAAGSPHRIEPILPYLEAYWYGITNQLSTNYSAFSTTLMSNTSSFYPPIVAALLVFVVFMFLYHEYGEFPAIIGAVLTTAMPALITTFIAGEQLAEPWGIFTLFFFYAAYLLAVNNLKEKKFAILAGIAFVSTFLGAHYYTVDAGVLGIYILLQGVIFVLKGEKTTDFYKMNAIVIGIIAVFYALFAPYGSVLTNRTPALLGVPIIIGLPLFALLFVAIFEYVPKFLASRKILFKQLDFKTYSLWLVVVAVIAIILIMFTSLGEPLQKYYTLSTHFTTPSIPLFATVQEYSPTGFNFNFGSAGFGIIGSTILGVNLIVWAVMIIFTILMILAIINRNSKFSILSLAAVWPLALAGMTEVKYLPHFGVGYILAIGAIIGELIILINNNFKFSDIKNVIPTLNFNLRPIKILVYVSIIIVLFESSIFIDILGAAANPNCNSLASSGNGIGYTLYCQQVSPAWLNATAWMKTNVGPYAPRILAWWDYGDWINWFGNSNAVLRGDNAVATEDYATAAQYVLSASDGVNATTLANYMTSIQSKYVLFDSELMQKWGALDFLACVNAGQTSLGYAVQQGQLHGQPYSLGGSACELNHDPVYALVPTTTNNINNYCQFSNASFQALKVIMLAGNSFLNSTYCVPATIYNSAAPAYLYDGNGTKLNALIIPTATFFYGTVPVNGQTLADFLVVYLPNGPNDTITNAPSLFYNSSYYRAFFFGKLPGFSLAYPMGNFTGINYINSTNPIVILQLNNYTGGNPPVTPKASYVTNNYTMPG
ncbi:MAG: hypothetical protein KGH65_03055 [Candidatus Micrarchaeota archaeon]|nr:hypothetical protein [Candidatus Micrarchaeota archaeon]